MMNIALSVHDRESARQTLRVRGKVEELVKSCISAEAELDLAKQIGSEASDRIRKTLAAIDEIRQERDKLIVKQRHSEVEDQASTVPNSLISNDLGTLGRLEEELFIAKVCFAEIKARSEDTQVRIQQLQYMLWLDGHIKADISTADCCPKSVNYTKSRLRDQQGRLDIA